MEIDILGIDLAKQVFQLHGADRRGRAVHRAKVSRGSLFEAVRTLAPGVVVMEACGTAHHWARRFQSLGIEVRLISPQYVTPFVKTNKNDRNDAEAIVEAASRPTMRFVTVKSVEQQDILAAHRMRAILIRHRTALINQMRGLLGERGFTISRSPEAFKCAIPELLRTAGDELTAFCQTLLSELLQHLTAIEDRIHLIDTSIQTFMKHSTLCKKIAAVPGIGPITATAIVGAVGNATQFRNGRHLAAWLGLVPRQYSSGGKSRLQGISRRGDTYLRTLLIHGARAVLRYVKGKTDPHSVWLQQMIARRGHNCTAVALANKNARIIQALLSGEASYVAPGTTA
ncbi:transposase [Paraburkholderia sp. BL23I1N1]|uniref:IS110 family transposase n=1 Tax=Paraburkholderia sp. BL23I1N1 TaxID=1938802 RepID=UPI000E751B5F|nr:IS110 family transposase [Paraburkholderia sp. BL23I1N1]RKE25658.1 transposase [Paraburkholderia sp. BL23I1N1]